MINPTPEVPTEAVTMHTAYTVLLLSLLPLPKDSVDSKGFVVAEMKTAILSNSDQTKLKGKENT